MKIYICQPSLQLVDEIRKASEKNADIALAVTDERMVYLFGISKLAQMILDELPFREFTTAIFDYAWICVTDIETLKKYFEERFEIEYLK